MTAVFAWICAGIAALATLGAAYFFDKSAEEGIAHARADAAQASEAAGKANERAAADTGRVASRVSSASERVHGEVETLWREMMQFLQRLTSAA